MSKSVHSFPYFNTSIHVGTVNFSLVELLVLVHIVLGHLTKRVSSMGGGRHGGHTQTFHGFWLETHPRGDKANILCLNPWLPESIFLTSLPRSWDAVEGSPLLPLSLPQFLSLLLHPPKYLSGSNIMHPHLYSTINSTNLELLVAWMYTTFFIHASGC